MNTKITIGNKTQAFFILSAAREGLSPLETVTRTDNLLDSVRAHGYSAARCTGRYAGVDESSVIVIDPRPEFASCTNYVMRLARVYGQESVLAVDANSAARLLFTDETVPESLGKFTSVPKAIAERTEAYTERLGWYYICVPVTG